MASNSPLHITVTGAAGQIGYALVHRIASGQLLGPDQPIVLRLLEIEPAMKALEGLVMELEDNYGISVSEEQAARIETVGDAVAFVVEHAPA